MSTETLNPHQSCRKHPPHHQHNHLNVNGGCGGGGGGFTSKSVESLYSGSGSGRSLSKPPSISLNMYKRKPARTTHTSGAPVSEVRQRVLSARMHRIRSMQNQLGDAQMHIGDLLNENRLLRTLHKRQDLALSKYDSTNAELPQLLHSHAEEIRMWQARVRNLQSQNKDLVLKIKQKDSVLLGMTDQNRHLHQLNSDKSLEERERLTERVAYLEMRLQEKDEEMKVSMRRSQLENKALRTQLHSEQAKVRDLMHKLDLTAAETSGTASLESSSTFLPPGKSINGKFISKMLPPGGRSHHVYHAKATNNNNAVTTEGAGGDCYANNPSNSNSNSNVSAVSVTNSTENRQTPALVSALKTRTNQSQLVVINELVGYKSETTMSSDSGCGQDATLLAPQKQQQQQQRLSTSSRAVETHHKTVAIAHERITPEEQPSELVQAVRNAMRTVPERNETNATTTTEEDTDGNFTDGTVVIGKVTDVTDDISSNDYDDEEEPEWDDDVSDDDDESQGKHNDSDETSSSSHADTFRKRTPLKKPLPSASTGTTSHSHRPDSPLDDIAQIRSNQRRDILRDESLLDSLCDSVVKKAHADGAAAADDKARLPSASPWTLSKSALPVPLARPPLDPKKKQQLQQALRAIDSN